MADIIDLEEYPEDFEDGAYGSRTPEQPRFITIKSYTEICIETGEKVETTPTTTRAKYPQEDSRKNTKVHEKQDVNSKRKKPPQKTGKGSEYPSGGARISKNDEQTRKRDSQQRKLPDAHGKVPCWFTVMACFCGVNNEYKWYSLKGKGLCLFVPMLVVYVVVSLAVLPFLAAAALGVAIFGCAGVASYLAVATNKVGVSLDEADSSCFSRVYGSWV